MKWRKIKVGMRVVPSKQSGSCTKDWLGDYIGNVTEIGSRYITVQWDGGWKPVNLLPIDLSPATQLRPA